MITKDNEPIYRLQNGSYIIQVNGFGYNATDTSAITKAEVTAYLLTHPEALIPEPVPPPPTGEELAARRVAEARGYLASTDWVIAKIGEAQMLGQDISPLVAKYQSVLDGRGTARETINGEGL